MDTAPQDQAHAHGHQQQKLPHRAEPLLFRLRRILFRAPKQIAQIGQKSDPKHNALEKADLVSRISQQQQKPGLEVHHLTKEEFDHGATRNVGAGYSKAQVMIFMTDDAVPRDRYLVERLVEALGKKGPGGETAAMAYARQMAAKDCGLVEQFTRKFNYPDQERVKTLKDLPELGIKTYFASNVCCGYRKEIFEEMGGFVGNAIFNEDMIYAAGVIKAGYAVAYVPEARVVHSHTRLALNSEIHLPLPPKCWD